MVAYHVDVGGSVLRRCFGMCVERGVTRSASAANGRETVRCEGGPSDE